MGESMHRGRHTCERVTPSTEGGRQQCVFKDRQTNRWVAWVTSLPVFKPGGGIQERPAHDAAPLPAGASDSVVKVLRCVWCFAPQRSPKYPFVKCTGYPGTLAMSSPPGFARDPDLWARECRKLRLFCLWPQLPICCCIQRVTVPIELPMYVPIALPMYLSIALPMAIPIALSIYTSISWPPLPSTSPQRRARDTYIPMQC